MRTIRFWLRVVTTMGCWLRNYPTSKAWDRRLNKMLDRPVFTKRDRYTVVLNGVEIWVSNYPYAYGRSRISDYLPTRRTVFRLRDTVEAFDNKGHEELDTDADAPVESSEWPEYVQGSWK